MSFPMMSAYDEGGGMRHVVQNINPELQRKLLNVESNF